MTEPSQEGTAAEEPAGEQGVSGSDHGGAAAEGYGVAEARALLRRFREDTGRDATSAEELAEWIIRRIR